MIWFNITCQKYLNKKDEEEELVLIRAQELCESQGGHPGLPFPNTVIVYIVCVDVKQR